MSKHAEATHVEVTVIRDDRQVVLRIVDDGRGFESAVVLKNPESGHFGLRLLADMARDVGGELRVDSIPGRGTRICMEVPLR